MTIDLNQLIKEYGYEAEINPPESPQDGLLRMAGRGPRRVGGDR